MFRVLLLSLCMGCTGISQQFPSCRISVPVSLAGREGAALARDYKPGDLRIRVGDEAVGGDLSAASADRLVILLDARESMRPFWPAALRATKEILAQLDPSKQVSVYLVSEMLREAHGLAAVRKLLDENTSAERLNGNMSLYSAMEDTTANFHGVGDAIVVLTSGLETVGKPEMNTARTLMVERGVRANAVMFLAQGQAAVDVLLGPYELETLAQRTGGSVTVVRPKEKNSQKLLGEDFVSKALAYSSLELRIPGGTSPRRLSIGWSGKDADRLPRFVAPPRVGPCPATLSAKAQRRPVSAMPWMPSPRSRALGSSDELRRARSGSFPGQERQFDGPLSLE